MHFSPDNGMEQKTSEIIEDKRATIFRPAGRLDITTAWQFRLKLQECISSDRPHVVINLKDVSFVDSSGLTSLVAGMRDADKVNGSFRLCNVHSEAQLVLEVTMMDSVFEIVPSEEDALKAID